MIVAAARNYQVRTDDTASSRAFKWVDDGGKDWGENCLHSNMTDDALFEHFGMTSKHTWNGSEWIAPLASQRSSPNAAVASSSRPHLSGVLGATPNPTPFKRKASPGTTPPRTAAPIKPQGREGKGKGRA